MTDRTSLLDKIRALLAKTKENGCTEPEALAALAKARALMDAYEVTDEDLALSKAESAVLHSDPPDARDPHKIKQHLALAVAAFCDCKVWRSLQSYTFCGFPSDVQFAAWLLDHLNDFVQAELAAYLICCLASKTERRKIITGFALGCTDRISKRLTQLCQHSATQQADNSRALVVIKSAAISEKMAELGIHLRKSSSRSGSFNHAACEAGHKAGERASFGRPVSGAAGALRLK